MDDIAEGKIPKLVALVATVINAQQHLARPENAELLMHTIHLSAPALRNRKVCANCGANMVMYTYELDCLDAVLLLAMAKEVRRRIEAGLQITAANQVQIQQMAGVTYAMKSRTTQMSKLGLIAQLVGENKRRVPGVWVITTRGWAALRGEPVPKKIRVWRNKIDERYTSQTITLAEAFRVHRDKVEDKIARGKKTRTDYRELFAGYVEGDWYTPEYHAPTLL